MTTEFKMVKVSDQGVQFGNAWYSHESITGYSADQLNQGNCCVTGGAYMKWLAAAPASPRAAQPVGMMLIDEYFDNREVGDVEVTLSSEACDQLARDYPGQSFPIFIHADAGEVEAIKRRCANAELALKYQTENCDTLRAQLAELWRATNLLMKVTPRNKGSFADKAAAMEIINALSTTAKPEADHE